MDLNKKELIKMICQHPKEDFGRRGIIVASASFVSSGGHYFHSSYPLPDLSMIHCFCLCLVHTDQPVVCFRFGLHKIPPQHPFNFNYVDPVLPGLFHSDGVPQEVSFSPIGTIFIPDLKFPKKTKDQYLCVEIVSNPGTKISFFSYLLVSEINKNLISAFE